MTKHTTRRARPTRVAGVVLVAAVAVAVAVVAGRAVLGGTSAEEASAEPTATSATPEPTAPLAVPVPVAPSALPVEPGPGFPVATDPEVVSAGGDVDVVITFVDAQKGGAVVGAFVSGVVEDGGTCTAVATRGGSTVTVEAQATADASTTTCGELAFASGALAAGSWDVVVSYSSASSDGESASTPVTVTA